ncbi:DUF5723 family protein [Williamwhitmania taraxaci]|uniref:Thrombospondin type 3 repeat-containing protein n=1 Tax=Williamwhitmania taraxaci TaxID=1640674 RepID=A0A1G6KW74_9BACT|nr:DUF5723 family protein [Williamwhitmania taraxaci]SDC35048.1 Thrombospondin type 3 repeat-containing protein [Williamwhitmania taraxaci]
MKKFLISGLVGVAYLLFTAPAIAQTDFTMYHMQLVPYRIYQNPALVPQARSFVGLPIISSIYFHGSNAFSYNNIISRTPDDSLKVDIPKLLGKLSDRNYLFTNFDVDLLSFGFRVADTYYITFSARERSMFRFMYPKDLINFAWQGNANIGLGKELNFAPKFDAMVFDEFALGLAQEVDDKLTVGFRFKILNGRANVNTSRAKASMYTDPNDFSFRLTSDILIRTAGIDSADNQSARDLILGGNHGFGIDLGATYKLNSQFSFSASVLDLGYINWKKQLLTYKSQRSGEVINFNGVDINDFISKDKNLGDAFQTVLDSLSDQFKVDTVYNQSYKTYLPTRFYAGADYNINDKNTVGLLFHGQFFDKRLVPSLSVSYYTQLGRVLGLSASYNIMNRSYNNVGVGLSLNLGAMQIYATTDNILAIPYYKSAQNAQFHTGMVYTFGRKPKDKDKDGVVDKMDECPLIPGLEQFKGCPDTDLDGIPDKDDLCPNVPGTAANKGCPDRDGDGVYDQVDECPDMIGLAEFKGCPDTDKDGITDKDDKCPNDSGSVALNGCPDRDGDGIVDPEDRCPEVAGPAEFYGCPDTDLDSVPDYLDRCPAEKGLFELKGCPDRDYDGVPDIDDACPDSTGSSLHKGCPDSDGDGLFDEEDRCPTEPGTLELQGCPWADSDMDGIKDAEDACPNAAGPIENKGCPYSDSDGDGIIDKEDKCPLTPGTVENHGCPEIKKEEQEVLNTAFSNLEFQSGKDIIKSESFASLANLADLMKSKSEWMLKIAGHTDSQGNRTMNILLSRKRTLAVKKFLVAKGIADSRVVAEWYGPDKPIADNKTPEGREKNRRVEMEILFK